MRAARVPTRTSIFSTNRDRNAPVEPTRRVRMTRRELHGAAPRATYERACVVLSDAACSTELRTSFSLQRSCSSREPRRPRPGKHRSELAELRSAPIESRAAERRSTRDGPSRRMDARFARRLERMRSEGWPTSRLQQTKRHARHHHRRSPSSRSVLRRRSTRSRSMRTTVVWSRSVDVCTAPP